MLIAKMLTNTKSTRTWALFAAISLSLLCEDVRAQRETRMWTSRDGQQIQATFSAYDPAKKRVSLVLMDDTSMEVDLGQLSPADKRYVLRVARKNHTREKASPRTSEEPATNRTARERKSKPGRISYQRYGIDWTQDIRQALRSAAGVEGERDDRPVMWMRVLGDLNGFM